MERVWPGRFKVLGESNNSDMDATTDISLTSRAPRDAENALRMGIAIDKKIEVTYEGHPHKDEEAALQSNVMFQTAEICRRSQPS